MIINTNVQALLTTKSLWHRNNALEKSSANLSMGTKINKVGDDPTGMAVANKFKMQLKGLEMSDRNVNDAISLIQTAEGSVTEMENIVQRMRELAVRGANDTLTDEDRTTIQQEIEQLSEELNSISEKTEFNNMKLLNNTDKDFIFHTGASSTDNATINLRSINADSLGLSTKPAPLFDDNLVPQRLNIDPLDYTTTEGSEQAIHRCDTAIKRINTYRANLGAMQNRLEKTSNSLLIAQESTNGALSRVLDTDMAGEMAEYTKNNVLVQAGISMLSQANQRPNQILSLLQ